VFAFLQRRPAIWLVGLVVAGQLTYRYAPMPEGYLDRIETIQTYEEVGDNSAIGRFHFWEVAQAMAQSNPLGVGLRRFDRAYDDYDFSGGQHGGRRSVHSSHFQVLAEVGYLGAAIWIAMFGYAMATCLRIRYRAGRASHLTPDDRRFYVAISTGFAASMVAFIVGGAFIALAINDLTWMTFAGVAAMHQRFMAERAVPVVERPVAFTAAAPVKPRRAIA
jgi:O-antigen ligase